MTIRELFLVRKMLLIIIVLVVTGIFNVNGQCVLQTRTYANFQGTYLEGLGVLGSPTVVGYMNNPENSINGDVKQSSTLGIPVGLLGLASVTQFLEFTTSGTNATRRVIAANTPVKLKFTIPTEVLGLLSGIEVGSFTGLHTVPENWPIVAGIGNFAGSDASNKTSIYSGATLLSLLNGSGDFEITLTPTTAFNGIYIKLKGNALSVALKADVFHAYIIENVVGSTDCNTPIDVLAGIRAGNLANLATATGQVDTKWDAIDADPINTFAELKLGAQVLSEVFHTTIFKTLAQPGDAVQMIIQKPGGGLLDLDLLNGFSIRMYNGPAAVGSAFSATSGLSLSLLPGSTAGNEKYILTIQVPKSAGAFDRVELKMGGLATVGLTPGIRIYDVKHTIIPKTAINGVDAASTTLCLGYTAALSVSELQDCTTYKWFTTSTGGTAIPGATSSYTPLASSLTVGPNIFYVEATRTNCTDIISRIPVTININPVPTFLPTAANVCKGILSTNLSYTGTNLTPLTSTYSITWSLAAIAAGFINVTNAVLTTTPINISVPNGVSPQNYSGSLTVINANSCISIPATISVQVHPKPLTPHVEVQ
jgi:hypothetical protein